MSRIDEAEQVWRWNACNRILGHVEQLAQSRATAALSDGASVGQQPNEKALAAAHFAALEHLRSLANGESVMIVGSGAAQGPAGAAPLATDAAEAVPQRAREPGPGEGA